MVDYLESFKQSSQQVSVMDSIWGGSENQLTAFRQAQAPRGAQSYNAMTLTTTGGSTGSSS